MSGFLSAWVPVGATESQTALSTASDTDATDGHAFHSNAALDSNVIYEAFSNFQAMPTTHDEFTNVKIAQNADLFKGWGVTSMQLAPQYRSSTDKTFLDSIIQNGYAFTDRYDMGFKTPTKYGTDEDLRQALKALHANGMQAIADFVPDQIYNLPGEEITNVSRTDDFGNSNPNSEMQNVLYATNSKGGGEYQAKFGGEFLSELQEKYPEIFTRQQISTGVPIDATTKIKEWSAKYFNGSDIQGKGQEYVLRDNATKEYFKVSSNSNDKSFLPKQMTNDQSSTGFEKTNAGVVYYSTSGYKAVNAFIKDDNGNYYYFDNNGYMVQGAQVIDGHNYYFLPNGVELRESFMQDKSGYAQYYGASGRLVKSQYITDQHANAYYFDNNGFMITDRTIVIDGNTHHFGKGGTQVKDDFVLDANNNLQYFAAGNGNLVTNSFRPDQNGSWYYLNNLGYAVKGWQNINGNKYFFDENGIQLKDALLPSSEGLRYVDKNDGHLVTNSLFSFGGNEYYANNDGVLHNGLQKIGNEFYYFDDATYVGLTSGVKVVDNHVYSFDNTGKGTMLTNQLITMPDGHREYVDVNGLLAKNQVVSIDGVQYGFDDKGQLVTNEYYEFADGWHYADENGHFVTGIRVIDGHTQYFNKQGIQVKNGFVLDEKSGKSYFFNGTEGALVKDDYFTLDGIHWYYADETGTFVTGFQEVRGQLQYFYQDGVQAKGVVVENPNNHTKYFFDADNGNGVAL